MKQEHEILLSLYLNDAEGMTNEQFDAFKSWLNATPENARHFVRACYIHRLIHDHLTGIDLQKRFSVTGGQEQANYLRQDGYCEAAFWEALSQDERAADAVEQLREPEEQLITGVRQRKALLKTERKKLPISVWASLGSLAALFIMIAYVILNPRVAKPVATVAESYRARWESRHVEPGMRLTDDQYAMKLLSGYIKLRFDNGAEVILEGPSEFQLVNSEQMRLSQGRLTAVVPPAASGFRVDTPQMSIIDLGTEFSTVVSSDNVAVHMYTGKASLQIGEAGNRKNTHILTEGQARRVYPATGRIETIELDRQNFVRRFDPESGFVWHGQSVDLASIIAGSDGFEPVRGIAGINPKTGQPVTGYRFTVHFSDATYAPVPLNAFVDGVFIPDSGLGENIISSAGHIFRECPDTAGQSNNPTGATSHDILTFCDFDHTTIPDSRQSKLPVFNNTAMGAAETPVVLMHSNVGITFDLQAIRNRTSKTRVSGFAGSFGFSELLRGKDCRADMWVLIDGQLRYKNIAFTPAEGILDIDIDISDSDRFLTLAVTDAAHTYEPGEGTYADDYVYLIKPRLILTGR